MTIMMFMDRMFLSWVSPENIAACLPAHILLFCFWSFFLGISEYTNTFVAQFYGASRPRAIAQATWQGIYFSLAGSFLSFLFFPLGLKIFEWSGHAPEVVALEKTYYSWFFLGGPFFILNGALSSFYSGRGKTKVVMAVNIITNLVNLVLAYGLIFGELGFPEWGIKGAAVATVSSTALTSVFYLFLFFSYGNNQAYYTRSAWRFNKDLMNRLVRFGTPSGINFLLEISAFTTFVFIVGRIGKTELAASNIALSLNMLAWFPMMGVSVATASLVGQYIGRKDHRTASKSAFTAFYSAEFYMLSFGVIYWGFPTYLIQWFHSGPNSDIPFAAIAPMGAKILLCMAFYQIFDAMLVTFSGALRGAGDTAFAMWACVICSWCIFVPGTFFVTETLHLGVYAAWIWVFLYSFMLGLIYLKRFYSGRWKNIEVIPRGNNLNSVAD